MGINLVRDTLFLIHNVLDEYTEIKDVATATVTDRHAVQCHIDTLGTSVHTALRHLTSEKLEMAKKCLDLMCVAGICRRLNSPWSSGLHLVPKRDGTWQPFGDYRRLNDKTTRDSYPLPHLHDSLLRL